MAFHGERERGTAGDWHKRLQSIPYVVVLKLGDLKHLCTVCNLGQLECFDLAMVRKPYVFSRNRISNFEF